MQKLRTIVEQHASWSELSIYVERIEAHRESDFSHSLENAKALLETIGKEICKVHGVELNPDSSINRVLKKAFSALGYTNTNLVNQISSALATIGQQIGELRNEIGTTSHGRSLDEIRERNNKVNLLTRDFLIDSTVIVAIFLIRAFEERQETQRATTDTLDYSEATDFNDYWDDLFGEFTMADYSYAASEILFNVDYQAYQTEYTAFMERDLEPAESEEES